MFLSFAYKIIIMKNLFYISCFIFLSQTLQAQQVVSIEGNGHVYQIADMTKTDKITWGGYEEIKVPTDNSSGALNTKAITTVIGNNPDFEGRTYAAKECENLVLENFDDWYLPAKDEAMLIYQNADKFQFEDRITLWTSTEASGTQAASIYMYNGTYYDVLKVDSYNYVCMRKVK